MSLQLKITPERQSLAKELEEEVNSSRQCIEKLKPVQGSRSSLASQLKDALSPNYNKYMLLEFFFFFKYNIYVIVIRDEFSRMVLFKFLL